MEEHKKEIDVDFKIVERRNMRREKPQQELYKPGSGKLRRSNQGPEDSSSESGSLRNSQATSASQSDFRSKSDSNTDFLVNRDQQRRSKKPDREFYVAKPIQSRDQLSPRSYDQDYHIQNGGDKNLNSDTKMSKRYSSSRSGHYGNSSGRADNQNEGRDPPVSNKNTRIGSEPRGMHSGSNWSRDRDRDRHKERDTRSVEPTGVGNRNNQGGEKIQAKPPTGRRHSIIGNYEQEKRRNHLKNLENLAPRFRKKYMEENGLSYEDTVWDGTTSVFQPSAPTQQSAADYYDSYNRVPVYSSRADYTARVGYHTLPISQRGRGRLQEPEFQPGPQFRSMTPDRGSISRSPINSRPGTPPRRFDNRPPSRPPSRSQMPNSYYDDSRSYNDYRGDRGRTNVFDRLGDRGSEPRQFQRDDRASEPRQFQRDSHRRHDDNSKPRKEEENRNRRGDEENRNRRNDRNEFWDDEKSKPERNRRDHPKKNERHRRRGGRDRRSSSRDTIRSTYESNGALSENNQSQRADRHIAVVTPTNEIDSKPVSPSFPSRMSSQQSPDRILTPKSSASSGFDSQTGPSSADCAPDINVEKVDKFEEPGPILDWNEEVELSHKLEVEVFSDAMTRSSSVTSLQEISTRSMPASTSTTPNTKKKRKSGGRRRSGSAYRDNTPVNNRSRKDSIASIESRDRDSFRVPQNPSSRNGRRRRRSSRDHRDSSFDRFHNRSRGPSRDVSFGRSHLAGTSENWRDEIRRSRQNSEREGSVLSRRVSSDRSRTNSELEDHPIDNTPKKGGILVLPSKSPDATPNLNADIPKLPDIKRSPAQQKTLFDPNNPKTPILVKSPGSRVAIPGFVDTVGSAPPQIYTTDQFGNLRPNWYDESSGDFNRCHVEYHALLRDIKKADTELQSIINKGLLLVNYDDVDNLRSFLKKALEYLLCKAIKFCQVANIEQHLWKILYYNIIEVTRKAITNDPDNKQQYKGFLLFLIDEGTKYFESLVANLEETYQFKVANYIGNNSMVSSKGLGFISLALLATQKIFLFLGDLGRYKEQVNETSNYGKCRQWYIKSHEINSKNGKPYNQLAVLAVYSKRKLDAVYYYMRSLMSSNPVPSARESLIALFDDNRKKFEQGEKKRREERLERQKQHMKQKESENHGAPTFLRKETWIHPEGGRRLHRTTKALQDELQDSEEEDLAALGSVDVNKRFVISYLHVHGKLINKIGMESFQDAAMQMLKEFRVLLQYSPVPLPCNRFLQLLALNMFTIESTQLKDPQLQQANTAYRSEYQERALIVSLQMFNLILERCVSILQEHVNTFREQKKAGSPLDSLPQDANVLLPAIKIWCDWMLCHSSVWNPPPSTQDFKVKCSSDLWSRLGLLMTILEAMDQDSMDMFIKKPREGYEAVRLPEDATLSGFTPLMFKEGEAAFAPSGQDVETAQMRLRVSKLLFFGTVYLCGLEPPVLKLEIEDDRRDYVSVVTSDPGRDSPQDEAILARNDDVLLEVSSGDEEDAGDDRNKPQDLSVSCETSSEIKDLLSRKLELEKRKKSQELHRERVMKILSQSVVSVHLKVKPKYLVPDTNCFIDHLDSIQNIAKSHTYTVMVPIVVLSELEGLSKGTPLPKMSGMSDPNVEHIQKVAVASRLALDFLKKRHPAVKCVTTRGAVLASTTFCTEDDTTWDGSISNDDKILTTCLVLCKNHASQQEITEGEPRHLVRDVVLLTEDRNLRVKAYARDVPVRALPDFMRWAGLG